MLGCYRRLSTAAPLAHQTRFGNGNDDMCIQTVDNSHAARPDEKEPQREGLAAK
jgi:hypothetical protein